MFKHQKAVAHKLLIKLQCQPFTSNFMLSALLGEFANINNQMAIQLLRTEPVLDKLTTAENP